MRKIYNLRFHNGNFLITDVMVTMSSFMCKETSTCVAISRPVAVTSNDWLPMQANHCLTNSLSFSIIRQIRYDVYISLLQMCRTTVCLTFKQGTFSISHIVNEFKQMQSNFKLWETDFWPVLHNPGETDSIPLVSYTVYALTVVTVSASPG